MLLPSLIPCSTRTVPGPKNGASTSREALLCRSLPTKMHRHLLCHRCAAITALPSLHCHCCAATTIAEQPPPLPLLCNHNKLLRGGAKIGPMVAWRGDENNNQWPTMTRSATTAERRGAMIESTWQGMDRGLPNNNQPILHAALCQTPRAKQAVRQQQRPL